MLWARRLETSQSVSDETTGGVAADDQGRVLVGGTVEPGERYATLGMWGSDGTPTSALVLNATPAPPATRASVQAVAWHKKWGFLVGGTTTVPLAVGQVSLSPPADVADGALFLLSLDSLGAAKTKYTSGRHAEVWGLAASDSGVSVGGLYSLTLGLVDPNSSGKDVGFIASLSDPAANKVEASTADTDAIAKGYASGIQGLRTSSGRTIVVNTADATPPYSFFGLTMVRVSELTGSATSLKLTFGDGTGFANLRGAIDEENAELVLCGHFTGSHVVGKLSGSEILTASPGGRDIVLLRRPLDAPAGIVSSALVFAGEGFKYCDNVVVAPGGDAIFTGHFDKVLGIGSNLAHQGITDGYVARVARDGTVRWTTPLPPSTPTGDVRAHQIALAPTGELYVAGKFRGGFVAAGETLTSQGGSDVFVARLQP